MKKYLLAATFLAAIPIVLGLARLAERLPRSEAAGAAEGLGGVSARDRVLSLFAAHRPGVDLVLAHDVGPCLD